MSVVLALGTLIPAVESSCFGSGFRLYITRGTYYVIFAVYISNKIKSMFLTFYFFKITFKKSEKKRAIHEQLPNTTIIFIYSLYSMGIAMRCVIKPILVANRCFFGEL